MASRRQNNNPPRSSTTSQAPNWFDMTIGKISSVGGAIIVIFTIGGGMFQVGRTYKENEKNLEMYDLKLKHEKAKDSLTKKIEELESVIKNRFNKNR